MLQNLLFFGFSETISISSKFFHKHRLKRPGQAEKSPLTLTNSENDNSFHFSTFALRIKSLEFFNFKCDGETVRRNH